MSDSPDEKEPVTVIVIGVRTFIVVFTVLLIALMVIIFIFFPAQNPFPFTNSKREFDPYPWIWMM